MILTNENLLLVYFYSFHFISFFFLFIFFSSLFVFRLIYRHISIMAYTFDNRCAKLLCHCDIESRYFCNLYFGLLLLLLFCWCMHLSISSSIFHLLRSFRILTIIILIYSFHFLKLLFLFSRRS